MHPSFKMPEVELADIVVALQEDMNITITLLGGVVIILNTIASGIIVNNGGSGLVPPPTPS